MTDTPSFISTQSFAELGNFSRQKAHRALARAFNGHAWREHQLVVRRVQGVGGKAGTRYEVYLPSLPPELQRRWRDQHGEPEDLPSVTTGQPVDAAPPAAEPDAGADWLWRMELIRPALALPARSRARGEAVRAIAARKHLAPDGARRAVSAGTIRKWIAAYEARGLAGLRRSKRTDRNRPRVVISREWDRAFPFSDDARNKIAAAARRKVRSLWAAGTPGCKHVQRLATVELVKLTRQAGATDTDAALFKLCRLPRPFIEAEREYSLIAVHDKDAKRFFDKHLPRITRHRDGMRPVELVAGDVHHLDILMRRDDGSTYTPKVVAWQDVATNRVFWSLFILPKGHGIRREHAIASFIAMIQHPQWGMPSRLYLDNGGEYNLMDFLKDALGLADWTQIIVRSLQDDRETAAVVGRARRAIIKARPYNAPAKPIEGIFGVLERGPLAMLTGWIGGDRMAKKTHNVGKAPKPFPFGPDELRAELGLALRYLHSTPQSGHLAGKSPDEAFAAAVAAGWQRTDIDPFALAAVFGERRTPTVDRGRVAFKGDVYYHDALLPLTGERVTAIRPVVAGDERVYVLDDKGGFLCAAERETRYGFTDGAGAVEQGRRTRTLNQRMKAMRRDTDRLDLADEMRAVVAFHGPGPTPPSAGVIRLSETHEAMGEELKNAPAARKRSRGERAADKLARQTLLLDQLDAPAADGAMTSPKTRSKKGAA